MDKPVKKETFISLALKIFLFVHLGFIGIIFLFCFVYKFVNPPIATLMLYRQWFYHYSIKPVLYVPLKKIPHQIRSMVIEIEDGRFYEHHGVDFAAIREAIEINKRMKRRFYGGSTITQQLARTLFLYPTKSFFRKYLEAIIAVEMDFILGKKRVLEIYLNSIEWGKGIFGVGRASYFYYNKPVQDLNFEEMAKLVTIISSPVKYNPDNFFKFRQLNQRYQYLLGIQLTGTNKETGASINAFNSDLLSLESIESNLEPVISNGIEVIQNLLPDNAIPEDNQELSPNSIEAQ